MSNKALSASLACPRNAHLLLVNAAFSACDKLQNSLIIQFLGKEVAQTSNLSIFYITPQTKKKGPPEGEPQTLYR
jgi:hypothetical protein